MWLEEGGQGKSPLSRFFDKSKICKRGNKSKKMSGIGPENEFSDKSIICIYFQVVSPKNPIFEEKALEERLRTTREEEREEREGGGFEATSLWGIKRVVRWVRRESSGGRVPERELWERERVVTCSSVKGELGGGGGGEKRERR